MLGLQQRCPHRTPAAQACWSRTGCLRGATLARPVRPSTRTKLLCRTAAPPVEQAQPPSPEPYEDEYEEEDEGPSTSGTIAPYVPERVQTYTPPSIRATGSLRPAAEWFPAWMQYRRREDNYVFWQDKFMRCSTDIPWHDKRWTVFSTIWYTVQHFRFYYTPPALRYFVYLGWRAVMSQVYAAHKAVVLWQCKFDAFLAAMGSGGAVNTFSKAMALRRLHWRNSWLGELLYAINLVKTGRVHFLPPVALPTPRPTFFFLF